MDGQTGGDKRNGMDRTGQTGQTGRDGWTLARTDGQDGRDKCGGMDGTGQIRRDKRDGTDGHQGQTVIERDGSHPGP